MTVGEFKQYLLEKGVPDSAELCINAEYGDNEETTSIEFTAISRSKFEKWDYSPLEIIWEDAEGDWEELYDEEDIAAYPRDGQITAVCVKGW